MCGLVLEESILGKAEQTLPHQQVQKPEWSTGHAGEGCHTYQFALTKDGREQIEQGQVPAPASKSLDLG